MPKIDWRPGTGRRGRPLRRVLGMGQRQGLIVLSSVAVVMVVIAAIAALGGFDDTPKTQTAAGGTADQNADGDSGGGNAGAPKDSTKASQILQASVQHYTDLLTDGQKIVGHTHYADMAAYGKAFADPKSPAAAFAKYRISPNPESDTSYIQAETQAAKADGGDHGSTLDKWARDMAKVRTDLGDWAATAVRYQQGTAPQAELDAAVATATQDLATAKADAALEG